MLSNCSRLILPAILGFAALLTVISTAHAGLIFDSGVELAEIDSGFNGTTGGGGLIGDDFTLGTAVVVDEVQWTGRYLGSVPTTDDFTIRFLDYSGTSPSDTALFSFSVGNA